MLKERMKSLRYFCTAALLLCISLLSVFSGISLARADAASLSIRESFESLALMTELENSTNKEGEPFDVNDYPYDSDGRLSVFTVSEFMYDVNDSENYGIYVYLYNPQQLELDEASGNRVSVATAFDDNVNGKDFKLFNLQYVSKTTGDYNGLFYKYRIIDEKNELYALQENRSHTRRYEFGQLLMVIDGRSEAYNFGLKCSFSGYSKGCNPDPMVKESTLTGTIDSTLTLTLDVGQTFYRTGYEYDVDKHLQMQLNSIYFSVPNDVIAKYGEMVEVSTWYLEAQTAPTLIIDDEKGADLFDWADFNENGFRYFTRDVGITGDIVHEYLPSVDAGMGTDVNTYHYSYGSTKLITSLFSSSLAGSIYVNATDNRDFTSTGFPLLFIGEKQEIERFDGTSYSDVVVPREEISSYIHIVSEHYTSGERLLFNGRNLKKDLFSSVDPDGGELGTYYKIKRDDMKTLTYLENKRPSFWTALFGPNYKDKELASVKSIEDVSLTDLTEAWEHSLYVDSADKEEFSSYVANATANDETTYLCRFAVSDYYSAEGEAKYSIDKKEYSCPVYLAQQQVYLDLTVLDCTFKVGDVYTTIAAVATPIDFIASVDGVSGVAPYEGAELPWWVWLIIGLLILAIALPILIALFPVVGQVLFAVLKLIIKAIWWLIKGLVWLTWQIIKLIGKGIYWLFWALSRPIVLLINKIREKRNGE